MRRCSGACRDWGVDLGSNAPGVERYSRKVFARASFLASLSPRERESRRAVVTEAPQGTMKPRRPYLLRALHEWISDSNCTPHLVVDATHAGVDVPRQYVKDGKIVLNVSWTATSNLKMGNDEVTFSARFGGSSLGVRVPIAAVLASTRARRGRA